MKDKWFTYPKLPFFVAIAGQGRPLVSDDLDRNKLIDPNAAN